MPRCKAFVQELADLPDCGAARFVFVDANFATNDTKETAQLFQVESRISDSRTMYSLFSGSLDGSEDYWIRCSCSNESLAVRSCPALSYKCSWAKQPTGSLRGLRPRDIPLFFPSSALNEVALVRGVRPASGLNDYFLRSSRPLLWSGGYRNSRKE